MAARSAAARSTFVLAAAARSLASAATACCAASLRAFASFSAAAFCAGPSLNAAVATMLTTWRPSGTARAASAGGPLLGFTTGPIAIGLARGLFNRGSLWLCAIVAGARLTHCECCICGCLSNSGDIERVDQAEEDCVDTLDDADPAGETSSGAKPSPPATPSLLATLPPPPSAAGVAASRMVQMRR